MMQLWLVNVQDQGGVAPLALHVCRCDLGSATCVWLYDGVRERVLVVNETITHTHMHTDTPYYKFVFTCCQRNSHGLEVKNIDDDTTTRPQSLRAAFFCSPNGIERGSVIGGGGQGG